MSKSGFSSLPKFLGNLVGTSPPTDKSSEGISRGFELFTQSVRRAKNEYEKEQIISRELETLKASFRDPNITEAQKRDYVWRLVYAKMLGFNVNFGLVEALKLCGGKPINDKTGFITSCLLLNRTDEVALLLTCMFQKTNTSSSILDNLMGMSACSQLAPVHVLPELIGGVLYHLKHPRELVRQKAVLCLHQFRVMVPDLMKPEEEALENMLYDKDPGVMAAAVHVIQYSIEQDPVRCLRFGETLVSILKQISSHKMASMFEYQSVPFPWLQIQIIKCLTKLAVTDESYARSLEPVLTDILQRTRAKETMVFAVIYECVQCILSIRPSKQLIDVAALHIQQFLLSPQPNLKFLGVKLLVMLVRVNPEYSMNYQQLIVESLENPDVNVQRKTHKLLYEIANESNVTVVCEKLFTQLQTSSDKFWRSEVITMILNLLERFEGDAGWRVERLFSCLQLGNDVISDKTLNSMMSLIEKKFLLYGSDEKRQKLLVQKCVEILVNKNSPCTSLHISTWVLGELCPLLKNMPDDKVISLFTRHLTNNRIGYLTQSSIVTALQNLVIKGVVNCDTMVTSINECLREQLPIVIKQSLSVLLGVCKYGLTISFSGNIDTTLTFLDDLVTDDLEQGRRPFVPPHLRGVPAEPEPSSGFFSGITSVSSLQDDTCSIERPRTESNSSSMKTADDSETLLKMPNVKRVWGKQGRLDTTPNSQIAETSITKTSGHSEGEKRQQELASALFGGFQSSKEEKEDLSGFLSGFSDTASWRNLHTSATKMKSTEQSTGQSVDIRDQCNTGKLEDLQSVISNTTDIHIENNRSFETTLLDTESINIFSENKSIAQLNEKEPLFDNGSNFGENNPDCFGRDGLDVQDKQVSSDNDFEQAFSGFLDSRVTKGEGSQSSGDDDSQLQENFEAFSEHITDENLKSFVEEDKSNTNTRTKNSIYDESW